MNTKVSYRPSRRMVSVVITIALAFGLLVFPPVLGVFIVLHAFVLIGIEMIFDVINGFTYLVSLVITGALWLTAFVLTLYFVGRKRGIRV